MAMGGGGVLTFLWSSQMLKHGRAGVPLEVMGLMLGEFVSLDVVLRLVDGADEALTGRRVYCAGHRFVLLPLLVEPVLMPIRQMCLRCLRVEPECRSRRSIRSSRRRCSTCSSRLDGELALGYSRERELIVRCAAGRRWWLDGTTRILDSAAGSRAST